MPPPKTMIAPTQIQVTSGETMKRNVAGGGAWRYRSTRPCSARPRNAAWSVGEAGYESRSDNSCFAGRTLNGRVLLTVAAGSIAYRERSLALAA